MGDSKLTRRALLRKTAAAGAAVGLGVPGFGAEAAEMAAVWPENGTPVPDEGWSLWVDERAVWKDDAIFLPEDVRLAELPVNAPTGGWEGLERGAAGTIPVTLPGTVEQHFWGKFGSRPYTPEEYRYAAEDAVPRNGAYLGVSWWYRKIEIPAAMRGRRIFLHVRGAHLRAEVYLNRRLVGYSIMEELPSEADLTGVARPGEENWLAIRVTNPFGRYDWVDGLNAQWGAVKLFRSHGFGGLDRGMTISAHEGARILDAWVLNTPDPRRVQLCVVREGGPFAGRANLPPRWELFDLQTQQRIGGWNFQETVKDNVLGAMPTYGDADGVYEHGEKAQWDPNHPSDNSSKTLYEIDIEFPGAMLWDLESPKLYGLRILSIASGGRDTRTVLFAFRSFAPEGLGSNAMFRLNGRRVKIYTAISWGFWGLNGIWPTPELAEKEVTQAKRLGLNCLNFHRNLAKEDVLRAHDRLGVLRYLEPGGGKMAIGKMPEGTAASANSVVMEKATGAADKFAQRYMLVKCVEMVKAFRSHPSVMEYCLQNEIGADLNNPDTLAVLVAMRAEDPSRCIVLNDGFVAPPRKAAQAWYEPWNDKLHRSDREAWGGWWNQHQGAGDQWYDEFYKSPTEFTYKAPYKDVITEFGEMEGCATPDNHSLMLHQQAGPKAGGIGAQPANTSYDHADHAEILAAYDGWLDRWGFRKAFPATEALWVSLGKKCYDTWQNYLENARISDELDFCAISGWESTAIENHSGIVDNLRNFKGDPGPIAGTLLPVRPVAKQRAMCTALGQAAVFDFYLLNDTGKAVAGTLEFSAVTPSGKLLRLAQFPAPAQTADVFSYLVKEEFATPPLTEEGMYRFKFSVSSLPINTHTKEVWVTELPCQCLAGLPWRVAVSGLSFAVRKQLEQLGRQFQVQEFTPGTKYHVIISSGVTGGTTGKQEAGETTGLEAAPASVVGAVQTTAQVGRMNPAVLEAVRAGTPLLAIPQADTLSEGVARQLAAAGAFTYEGTIGDFRAPWMGNWYFVREHPVYAGMPVNQAMGIHYAARGRESNGLLVSGEHVEIVVGYSRDHDRRIGAGTFTTRLGAGKVLYQRVPELHPVLQQRFLANALRWLVG